MKAKLIISKSGRTLYEGVHTFVDAETCGQAFADVWATLHNARLQKTTSVGQLMDIVNDEVIDELDQAQINIIPETGSNRPAE